MLNQLLPLQAYRGPLVALAVALGLALCGRFLRSSWLTIAAGGAGVVAGWFVLVGRFWSAPPVASSQVLPELATVTLCIGLICAWVGPGRVAAAGVPLAALATAWLLSDGPRHLAALRAIWPVALGVMAGVLVLARALTKAVDPLRPAMAGLTLAASLHVIGASSLWVHLALVPALAAMGMLAIAQNSEAAVLPVAVDIGALACLVAIDLGRLPGLGFSGPDAAALAPLLAVWLLPRVTDRLRVAGRAAPLAGCLVSGAAAVGCVWAVRLLLHR
jgi:hypothetical protein